MILTTIKKWLRRKLMSKGYVMFKLPDTQHLSQYSVEDSSQRIKKLDFQRLEIIKNASIKELKDVDSLIKILKKCGLNNEFIHEFPQQLYADAGQGLYSWQYPIQFARYLIKLSELSIQSYLEIGVRHGGSFLITVEYLKRFNPSFNQAIGVDIDYSPILDEYMRKAKEKKRDISLDYKIMDSQSTNFAKLIDDLDIDLVLIDGDHNLIPCKNDFLLLKDKAKYIAFHDISSIVCPGVCAVWMYAKSVTKNTTTFEFIEQYDEVVNQTSNSYLGLGLLVNNNYLKK